MAGELAVVVGKDSEDGENMKRKRTEKVERRACINHTLHSPPGSSVVGGGPPALNVLAVLAVTTT